MRTLVATAALLMFAAVGMAQTCTPVKLSKSYTIRDDGTGPYMTFVVDGTAYNQESTINLNPANSITNYTIYHGYVDVFAGFGGCTQYWYINGFNYYYGLYDLTTGHWVLDTPVQSPIEDIACGRVPACAFSNTGNQYTMNVVQGHHYHLWAFVSMGTSVGSTSWYSDYVTIDVQ